MIKIAIDPGHGGRDRGASAMGADEARINYEMAVFLSERLAMRHSAEPFDVMVTRGPDEDPPFSERGRRAREFGAELAIVIHCNSHHNPQAKGAECYYWPGDEAGKAVARAILGAMPHPLNVRQSPFAADLPTRAEDEYLHRVRSTMREHQSARVLVEMGYLSSDSDRAALLDPATQSAVMLAMMAGAARFRQIVESPHIAGVR